MSGGEKPGGDQDLRSPLPVLPAHLLRGDSVLDAALESLEEGLLVVSGSGIVTHCNARFREIWSVPEQLLRDREDRVLLEHVASQILDPGSFKAAVGALYGGREHSHDVLHLKDGRILERFSSPLEFPGEERGRLWVFRDATARYRAEAALRDREARLESILRAVPVGIGLIVDRTILEVNDAVVRISGYAREECVGRTARFHYPTQEDYEAAGEIYRRLEAGERTASLQTRWLRKDGALIQVVLAGAPLDPQDLSRGVTVTVEDVTERLAAEQALRASEALLSETQRIAHMGSWSLDLASGRLAYTDECFRIMGYAPGSVEFNLDVLFTRILPEDQPQARAHFRETLLRGEFRPLEYRITRPDGAVRWVHVTGAVRLDENGHAVQFYGTQQDVTEFKRIQEDRLALERQALHAQKLESLGLLAGGFAHDFNNLLTAILANVSLVLDELPPGSRTGARLERARDASLCAADLCRQILAFSGRGSFVVEAQDLNPLVRSMAALLEASIPKKVKLEFDLAPDLPPLRGDAAQLHQVIMNLVLNATDALGGGAGTVRIATRVQAEAPPSPTPAGGDGLPGGPFVVLEVSDTGCGMAPEILAHIFDPFYTTKVAGRGLGLAAVQGILRGHRGAVQVHSEPGVGTTFTLFFPAGGSGSPSPEVGGDPPPAFRAGGTLLLVDDETLVLDAVGAMLRKLGFQVLTADDGGAALEVFQAHRAEVRLIILDLTMPRMDGAEAFRALRKLDPRVPILVASGYSEQEVSGLFGGAEVAAFLQKPFTRAALETRLAELLPP